MSNFLFSVLVAGVIVFVLSVGYYNYVLKAENQASPQELSPGAGFRAPLPE